MFVCTSCMNRYSFWKFLGDFFLICITGGLWIIGIIIREIRNASYRRCYGRQSCCGF